MFKSEQLKHKSAAALLRAVRLSAYYDAARDAVSAYQPPERDKAFVRQTQSQEKQKQRLDDADRYLTPKQKARLKALLIVSFVAEADPQIAGRHQPSDLNHLKQSFSKNWLSTAGEKQKLVCLNGDKPFPNMDKSVPLFFKRHLDGMLNHAKADGQQCKNPVLILA